MREVSVRDTASGERRVIDPESEVAIYACGPTVYSRIHIGNARPFVVFSLFARFLRSEGYDVRLIINVTDINDKIYEAAGAAGVASDALAGEMTGAYRADTARLGLGRPDAEPLASETIEVRCYEAEAGPPLDLTGPVVIDPGDGSDLAAAFYPLIRTNRDTMRPEKFTLARGGVPWLVESAVAELSESPSFGALPRVL